MPSARWVGPTGSLSRPGVTHSIQQGPDHDPASERAPTLAKMRFRAPQLRSDLEAFALSKRKKPGLVGSYVPEGPTTRHAVGVSAPDDVKFEAQGMSSPSILPNSKVPYPPSSLLDVAE